MAKNQSGLPEGFDLNVSAEELSGPASIPGYLDEDPVLTFARIQKAQKEKSASEAKALVQAFQTPPEVQTPKVVAPQVEVAPQPVTRVEARVEPPQDKPKRIQPAQLDRKRLQINLDGDTERMLEEILNLLSSQSSENQIKVSELFQALLMSLYNAKGEIVLGSLPTRGRWGSPTAKAFPVNLAESLREAIVNHEKSTGGSPFKKVVGG